MQHKPDPKVKSRLATSPFPPENDWPRYRPPDTPFAPMDGATIAAELETDAPNASTPNAKSQKDPYVF